MIDVVTRFIPDFMTQPQYKSQKEAVKTTLENSGTDMTRREIASEIEEMPSAVSARLSELVNEGEAVKIKDWRECSEADHNQEVNVYGINPFHLQGLENDE